MSRWLLRLGGLLLFALAGWLYVTVWARTSLVCDRAAGHCTIVTERLRESPPPQTIALADLLGAYMQHAYWKESPRARAALERSQTLDEVPSEDIWESDPSQTDNSGGRLVLFTRKGLVPLTTDFTTSSDASSSIPDFNRWVAKQEPGRFELREDERFEAALSAVLPCFFGVVLLVASRRREPEPID